MDPLVWLEQKVLASDRQPFDEFGFSVAVSGNTALIGARFAGDGGVVYVFTRSDGVWQQTQVLTGSDEQPFNVSLGDG